MVPKPQVHGSHLQVQGLVAPRGRAVRSVVVTVVVAAVVVTVVGGRGR